MDGGTEFKRHWQTSLFGEIKSENLWMVDSFNNGTNYIPSRGIFLARVRVRFKGSISQRRDEKVLTEEDKFNSSLACVLCPIVFES